MEPGSSPSNIFICIYKYMYAYIYIYVCMCIYIYIQHIDLCLHDDFFRNHRGDTWIMNTSPNLFYSHRYSFWCGDRMILRKMSHSNIQHITCWGETPALRRAKIKVSIRDPWICEPKNIRKKPTPPVSLFRPNLKLRANTPRKIACSKFTTHAQNAACRQANPRHFCKWCSFSPGGIW